MMQSSGKVLKHLLGATAIAFLVCLLPSMSGAQSSFEVQQLQNQVNRLQREVQRLQQEVARRPAAPPAFGNTGANIDTGGFANYEVRLSNLEGEIRNLTGQVERLNFRLNQVEQSLSASGAGVPNTGANAGSSTGSNTGQAIPQTTNPAAGQAQVLGTITQDQIETYGNSQTNSQPTGTQAQGQETYPPQTSSSQQAALPDGSPQDQYRYGFGLLQQSRYEDAAASFAAFIEAHPEHNLAGNAKYWLGETYYVRGDFQTAAIHFAEGYQKYPNSSKAPDNLLKLGLSLSNMQATQDACNTLGELRKRYTNAPPSILSRAAQEMQKLGCRG